MQKTAVESSGINWVAYDDDERILSVEFASGAAYRYFDVPRSTFDWLLKAESKGKFVNRLVKDEYRYEAIDPEPGAEPGPDDLADLLKGSLAGTTDGDADG